MNAIVIVLLPFIGLITKNFSLLMEPKRLSLTFFLTNNPNNDPAQLQPNSLQSVEAPKLIQEQQWTP
jgi:hypothetical protein